MVRIGDEEVLDRVLLAGDVADDPLAAAVLAPVRVDGLALDVAAARDRDHDVLVGDQVLVGHLAAGVVGDAGSALAGVLLLELGQLVLDDPADPGRVGQDVLELGDQLDDRQVLVLDLLAFEGGQAGQPHVEDGLGLELGQVEPAHQVGPGEVHVGRVADRLDDRVEVVERDLEPFEDVRPGARLAEIELGPAPDDLAAVVEPVDEDAAQREGLRLAVDEREHVHVERELHRRVLEQVVEHLVRVGVALELDVDAHPVAVGLVAQVADPVDPLVLDQLRDLLEQAGLVHLVGQLGDDDRDPVALDVLERDLGAHDHPAAAVGVHQPDGVDRLPLPAQQVALLLVAEDRPPSREVRSGDVLAEVVGGQLGVVDQGDRRVGDLAEVVRRDVRGHADRDAGAAVDQQVRDLRREDGRLLLRPVVVVDEVDGLLVDVGEHLAGDRREPRLRVAHRGRAVAVDRAEVALAVDERVAHREVLGEADQRVVQGHVAVRVVLAHHLADDRRALAERAGGGQAHLAHREQDPAVHRLETVADVGQGTRHDHAHRVVEVADPHLVLDADHPGVALVVSHGRSLLVGSGQRWFWVDGGIGQLAEPGRCLGRATTWVRRPGACGCPTRRSRSSSATAGSSLDSESRMTQARWPSPVVAASSVWARRAAVVAVAVELGERAIRPRQCLLDVRLGVAHELVEEAERARGELGIPTGPPPAVGHRGDRRSDQPALPSRRAVDELLELGPAVRLPCHAAAVRVGQRVDRDPVVGLASRAPEQLPGPLGLGRRACDRAGRTRTSGSRAPSRGTGDRR